MAKYIVSRSDGTPVPEDEPCFVIRAKDVLATEMVSHYMTQARKLNLPVDFIQEIGSHLDKVHAWQFLNRSKVQIPD